tara:strand:- start:535 stop:1134 length:600 start_codon:yes stop_codon:yes gene_type:complete
MDEEYFDVILQGGPIPGSSLTSDPNDPAPYEQPPEYVNVHEASEWLFSELIEKDRYDQLITALHEGIPVADVAQVILFSGFTQGKWDVNLMTLMIEPAMYIIMALAERAGVDFILHRDEDSEEDENDALTLGAELSKTRLENIKKFKEMQMSLPFLSEESQKRLDTIQPADVVDGDANVEMEEEPVESLLAAPQQEVMG